MLGLVNYEAVEERVWWCLNMFDDVWSMFFHDFQTRHLNISSWRTESEWIRMADADDSNAIYWSGLGRWCPRGLDDLDGTTLFVDICWVARHLHRSQTLSKQWFWNILSKQTACACGLWRSLCQVPRWFESNFQQSTQALSVRHDSTRHKLQPMVATRKLLPRWLLLVCKDWRWIRWHMSPLLF